jgi:hypothetical protein
MRLECNEKPGKKIFEFTEEIKRHADLYIFCLLAHKDKQTVDPLNLDQWVFYLLETAKLDEKFPHQKKLGLTSLLKLNPHVCTFFDLKPVIDKLKMIHRG